MAHIMLAIVQAEYRLADAVAAEFRRSRRTCIGVVAGRCILEPAMVRVRDDRRTIVKFDGETLPTGRDWREIRHLADIARGVENAVADLQGTLRSPPLRRRDRRVERQRRPPLYFGPPPAIVPNPEESPPPPPPPLSPPPPHLPLPPPRPPRPPTCRQRIAAGGRA